MDAFRNVGLIGRPGSAGVAETLRHLIDFLESRHLHVLLETQTAELLPGHGRQESSRGMLGESCDLVIVVGGDGSLLGAARALARFDVPVLGVNRGRLGFLTDISPEEIDLKVGQVLNGEYELEQRFLLEMEIKRDGAIMADGNALNDIVLHSGSHVHMIDFDLYVEGQYVNTQRSDGLIVATPTGSTAYALSGGGPIMHPRLDAIAMVPMHPHALSSRPIVVDGNSEIKMSIRSREVMPQVSCDGQSSTGMEEGDWLYIRKHPYKLKLLHPYGHDFYAACRTKLGWSNWS